MYEHVCTECWEIWWNHESKDTCPKCGSTHVVSKYVD
jgi:rRNA maturation endonuclease Nob1